MLLECYASAVVGPMMQRTSETLLDGKPPCRACSWIISKVQ